MTPVVLERKQVAGVLQEIGTLLELKGENPFKARAYAAAARTLEALDEDLGKLIAEDRLKELPGIGEALAEKIVTLATAGKLPYHEDLKREIPPGLLEMIQIPGLGPKRARALHESLGIATVEELAAACAAGRLAGLPGFGSKTQDAILQGIAFLRRHVGYVLLDEATSQAGTLIARLEAIPGVREARFAGSLRRRKEVVRDIDLIAACARGSKPGKIIERFVHLPGVERVIGAGDTRASVVMETGRQVDLRVVTETEFPFALLYFTGSAEHNIALRRRAQALGCKINEYGLWKGARRIACRDEEAIYRKLGLDFIPPELREDWGEIDAAETGELPRLVRREEIKGVFHVHSTWSDGTDSLEAMVRAAAELGYAYVGISEHSRSAGYAGGLSIEKVEQQRKAIAALRRKYAKLKILHGTESDILKDGSLDYPDSVLEKLDFVVGSVHSNFTLDEEEQTRRVIRALEHPRLTFLGHPTGRLLLQREGFHLDMDRVLEAAARTGKIVEINASPHRLDLDWRRCRQAKKLGVRTSVNPDAHSREGLSDVAYGVDTARRGWLTRDDVINTRDWQGVRKLIRIAS